MFLPKEKLKHINAITHEGKVVVVGTDGDGQIWYTIKQDGFEDSSLSKRPEDRIGWEEWREVEFPNEAKDDHSVVEKETEEFTYSNDSSKFILKSCYRTQDLSAVAPVQL